MEERTIKDVFSEMSIEIDELEELAIRLYEDPDTVPSKKIRYLPLRKIANKLRTLKEEGEKSVGG